MSRPSCTRRAALAIALGLLGCARSTLDDAAFDPGWAACPTSGDGAGGTGGPGPRGASGEASGGGGLPALPSFIPAERCSDVVFDDKRQVLYLSMSGGTVLRYDFRLQDFDTPLPIEGSLLGMALSADQNTLVVADGWYREADASTLAVSRLHVFDLESGDNRTFEFRDELYQGGTYMPAFVDDTTVLVSARYPGTGDAPLRRVNVIDGGYEIVSHPSQDTALVPSGDGSVVAFAESNISSGDFGFIDVATGVITRGYTDWFNHTIGVSRDATQYAVPTYDGTFVYDGALRQVTQIGTYADEFPEGVVYSPIADIVYFFWRDRDSVHPSVEAYDTRSFERLAVIDSARLFASNPFEPGQMRISRDGRLLFVLLYDRVNVYPLPGPG